MLEKNVYHKISKFHSLKAPVVTIDDMDYWFPINLTESLKNVSKKCFIFLNDEYDVINYKRQSVEFYDSMFQILDREYECIRHLVEMKMICPECEMEKLGQYVNNNQMTHSCLYRIGVSGSQVYEGCLMNVINSCSKFKNLSIHELSEIYKIRDRKFKKLSLMKNNQKFIEKLSNHNIEEEK